MNNKDTKLIKKIVNEYLRFMKKTSTAVAEAKKATAIALKKVLNLKDGETVLIKDDGSLEVIPEVTAKEN